MKRYLVCVEYDGTLYKGFQSQKKGETTIQSELEKALFLLTGEKVNIVPSGRTDAGVHAKGQMCHFDLEKDFDVNKLPRAINNFLPLDISIKMAKLVHNGFNARKDAVDKTYRYSIHQELNRSPLNRLYAFNTSYNLDVEKMKKAAQYFEGEHDFKAFQKVGSSVKTTVRTIKELRVVSDNGTDIHIYITATGFLYNMVRIIAGTLFEVGIGKMEPDKICDIINSKDRSNAGKTLPANGLTLIKVNYEK